MVTCIKKILSSIFGKSKTDNAPVDVEALLRRGNEFFGKKDYARAIADYTAVLKIDPTADGVLINRGFAYHQGEKYSKAVADYTAALSINPNNAEVLARRSHAYMMKDDYDKAIADAKAALALDPNNMAAKMTLVGAEKLNR